MTHPDPTPDEARTTCPTCGAAVVVETSDEGTSFYRPEARRETEGDMAMVADLLEGSAREAVRSCNPVTRGVAAAVLREAARRLRSAPAAEGWRPIETAPKDGTPIRIYADGLKDEDFNPSGSVEGFWCDGEWLGAVWNPQHDYWMALPIKPTHWMPLPVGPSIPTEREEGT